MLHSFSTASPSILNSPCSSQAQHALVHAELHSLMSPSEHKLLTQAILSPNSSYPESTNTAALTFLTREFPASVPQIALFTSNESSSTASLFQLSSQAPSTLYSFSGTLRLVELPCFTTTSQHTYKLPPLTNQVITENLALATHTFLRHTLAAAERPQESLSLPHMPCPGNALQDQPIYSAHYLLVSNLFLGHANRSLQLSDLLKLAKNLNIHLDTAHLMDTLNPDIIRQHELFPFYDTHSVYIKLQTPILVSSHYNPSTNTYPPDWYISNPSDSTFPTTEYFIQPISTPHHTKLTAFITLSGILQSSSYQTKFRFSALRRVKTLLPHKARLALQACYHNISQPHLPAETVLVLYLPTSLHTLSQRHTLQQHLLRELGHGAPATLAQPFRNISLDFFEAIMAVPSGSPLTSTYHLQLQQAHAHHYYYSAVQPYVPFQATIACIQPLDTQIAGAVIIERHFDSLCKCSVISHTSNPLYSSLAIRTNQPTRLPLPLSISQMQPFLVPAGSRQFTWHTQNLPFMNRTSWPRLYAMHQQHHVKPSPIKSSRPPHVTTANTTITPSARRVTFTMPQPQAWTRPQPHLAQSPTPTRVWEQRHPRARPATAITEARGRLNK